LDRHVPNILSIVYSPATDNPRPEDRYHRIPIMTVTLAPGAGIAGDRKGKWPGRQINVMSAATLEQLRAEGFQTGPGQMGEQIVLSGIDVDNLAAGVQLRLGSDAVIEVVKPRTGCDRFEHIQKKPKGTVAGRLGVLAAVTVGGAVAVGDEVTLLSKPVNAV
jgi:MOSC domain-containing protein YiiM